MFNVAPCDKDDLPFGLGGEAGIEIYCNSSFSDVVFVKSKNSIVVTYDHGACVSEPLTNQDIDLIIDFLNTNRPTQ